MFARMELDTSAITAALQGALPGLQGIWVFGSAASGTSHPDSDVDVAVLCTAPMTSAELTGARSALSDIIRQPIDLVDLGDRGVSTVLHNEIVTHGRLIADLDPLATGLRAVHIQLEYFDLMEARQDLDARICARGAVHAS